MKDVFLLSTRRPTNSLDASGGSASRNQLGAAKGDLIRAAASTQPLDCIFIYPNLKGAIYEMAIDHDRPASH